MTMNTRHIAAKDPTTDDVRELIDIALTRNGNGTERNREGIAARLTEAVGGKDDPQVRVAVVTTRGDQMHLTLRVDGRDGNDETVTKTLTGGFDHELALSGGDLALKMTTLDTGRLP